MTFNHIIVYHRYTIIKRIFVFSINMTTYINTPTTVGPTKISAAGNHLYSTDDILNVNADLIIRTGLTNDVNDSFNFSAELFIDATGIPTDSTYNGNSVTVTIRNDSEEHTITFGPLNSPATAGINLGISTVWKGNLVIPPMGSRTLVFIQTDSNKLFIDCIDLFSVTGPRNTPSTGAVLTSDANGLTSWTTLAASAAVHIGIDLVGPAGDVVISPAIGTSASIAFAGVPAYLDGGFTYASAGDPVSILTSGVYQISYSTTIKSFDSNGNKTVLIEFDLYNGGAKMIGSTTNSTIVTQAGDGYRVTSSKSIIRPLSAGNTITVKFNRLIGTGSCSIAANQSSLSLLLIK
jgi:hypothetical protein